MLTTDRVAGAALALIALGVIEESWRAGLPLGTVYNPGPAYVPVVLAAILLVFGGLVAVLGAGAPRVSAVRWSEWRHAAAILGACAFAAFALERLGYRLTVAVIVAFLVGVLERKPVVGTIVYTLAFALGSFWLFDTLLRVPLPRGPFGL